MKSAAVLPPAPLNATCPLWMLIEWSEVFRNGLASRSKLLLEVMDRDGPENAGERWLALVTWDLRSEHLRTALPPALHREYRIPDSSESLVRATVGELFHQFKSAGQSVWFVDLSRWGGAAIFIRKPADDPALAKILTFNRQGRTPVKWRLPRFRSYPAELRRAQVERWAAEQKAKALSPKKTAKADLAQRGESPPRRRRQGGTPQA